MDRNMPGVTPGLPITVGMFEFYIIQRCLVSAAPAVVEFVKYYHLGIVLFIYIALIESAPFARYSVPSSLKVVPDLAKNDKSNPFCKPRRYS